MRWSEGQPAREGVLIGRSEEGRGMREWRVYQRRTSPGSTERERLKKMDDPRTIGHDRRRGGPPREQSGPVIHHREDSPPETGSPGL